MAKRAGIIEWARKRWRAVKPVAIRALFLFVGLAIGKVIGPSTEPVGTPLFWQASALSALIVTLFIWPLEDSDK